MIFPPEIDARARLLLDFCRAQKLTLALAESCTGGLIAGCLTGISGASEVLERGFVVYANRAKEELLGVSSQILRRCGAVSEETARAMVEGAINRSRVDLALAVTGIAGPGGGTPDKPVGLVHLAAQRRGQNPHLRRMHFSGDREAVRLASIACGLDLLLETAQSRPD